MGADLDNDQRASGDSMTGDQSADIAELAKHFDYLDRLRESGKTNMYGARPFVMKRFRLGEDRAGKVLSLWMKTFNRDETPEQRAAKAVGDTR